MSKSSSNGCSVLDIGCGWSECLSYFKQKGLNVFGIDPSPEAVQHGVNNGLNVQESSIENIKAFSGVKFDLIMFNNVLEHLSDPFESINSVVSSFMHENSVLVIDVPNEFNDFQLAAQELHNLDEWWVAPPAHLNYFSLSSLTSLLRSCSLNVLHSESSFPLELFMLFGDCYVGNSTLGSICHQKRVSFETNLRKLGYSSKLREFYSSLAKIGIGRQLRVYAQL